MMIGGLASPLEYATYVQRSKIGDIFIAKFRAPPKFARRQRCSQSLEQAFLRIRQAYLMSMDMKSKAPMRSHISLERAERPHTSMVSGYSTLLP